MLTSSPAESYSLRVPLGEPDFPFGTVRELSENRSAPILESTTPGWILQNLPKDPVSLARLLYNLFDSFPEDVKTKEGRLNVQESLYFFLSLVIQRKQQELQISRPQETNDFLKFGVVGFNFCLSSGKCLRTDLGIAFLARKNFIAQERNNREFCGTPLSLDQRELHFRLEQDCFRVSTRYCHPVFLLPRALDSAGDLTMRGLKNLCLAFWISKKFGYELDDFFLASDFFVQPLPLFLRQRGFTIQENLEIVMAGISSKCSLGLLKGEVLSDDDPYVVLLLTMPLRQNKHEKFGVRLRAERQSDGFEVILCDCLDSKRAIQSLKAGSYLLNAADSITFINPADGSSTIIGLNQIKLRAGAWRTSLRDI